MGRPRKAGVVLPSHVHAVTWRSGRVAYYWQAHRGTAAFAAAFKPQRSLLVGGDGIGLAEFLSRPVVHWISG